MSIITARGRCARTDSQASDISTPNVLSSDPRPTLSFTDDGPGKLSVIGPRNDNDHDQFRKIKVLPTPDEILAVGRPIYMPKKDLIHEHFLDNGPARHLDTLFRQLRHDSTEIIRDICYSAAQIGFLKTGTLPEEHVRQETHAGNRYFLYRNIKIEEMVSHEHKSMVGRVSFECPAFMRGQKLYDSGRFKEGMLLVLLELDHRTKEFSVYYLEVSLAQSTFSMESFGGKGRRAAVQVSFLPTSNHDDILQICRYALDLRPECELYLVEFPKLLFAGFYNCLKCLQTMNETDFAFPQYVAPEMKIEEAMQAMHLSATIGKLPQFPCPPPAYARAPDFTYNLSKIVPSTSSIAYISTEELSRPQTLEILQRETSLDEGQVLAFKDTLLRDFACTQGPPGCGKTFLGAKLAQTLIDSRVSQKPILVVCLTNHALDSFLADLRETGVSGLLRIGSGSKEEWTDSINLRTVRKKMRYKREEFTVFHANSLQKKQTIGDLDWLCKAASYHTHGGAISWHYIEAVLHNHYPDIHAQFTTKAKFSLAQAFTFEYWAGGGDLRTIRDLHHELATRLAQVSAKHDKLPEEEIDSMLSELSWDVELRSLSAGSSSIWNMPLRERQLLVQKWEEQVDKDGVAQKLASLYFESRDHEREIKRVQDDRDARIMSTHNLIALTSTACAARWDLLRSLDLEILLCEEAAEVMESHTICSLLPSIQHAIFIGDPLQLRPETNEHSLSLESSVGREYRLDESLLERLMLPQYMSASVIPASHLNVQRRMHPDIANITRLTYPYLKDHASTLQREPTHGIANRMFWWDHRVPELQADDLKSHANAHEVEMVASMVEHLLRGGAYSQGEIAVLTPYAGQLLKLYERLATTCDIWLSDKDRENLLDEEVLALGEEGRASKDEVAISDMLRVATVDNFQGEEAAVIILSCVRSGGAAGFLKNLNRINVACSRARNGFYIIGDSQTLSQVPMWRQVVQTFNGRIGASIKTKCHRHPEHSHLVQLPEDFEKVPDCSAVCAEQLDCGHQCTQLCHPEKLHARLVCQEACLKTFECGHKCTKRCYQTCGECNTTLDSVTLDCGHPGQLLCSGNTSKCAVAVASKPLDCRHIVKILCGDDPATKSVCQEPCGAWLPCQHNCKAKCGQCGAKKNHPPCAEVCNAPKACRHTCKQTCHADRPCPSGCLEPCLDFCAHGPCKRRCQDACDPCVQQAKPGCDHESLDMLCCLPSLSLPCCEKCTKTLECGHVCPSLCGEICPPSKLCPECANGERPVTLIYSSQCQHLVEVSHLDAINLHALYELDSAGTILSLNPDLWRRDIGAPQCTCDMLLEGTRRYKLHERLSNFPATFDLLLAKMGRKLAAFADAVESEEARLAKSFESFVEDVRPNPLASRSNTAHLLQRNKEILRLQKHIADFRDEVINAILRDIGRLHQELPNIVPPYALMFGIHFDVLEYRVVNVRLDDAVKLGVHLLTLQDPSFGVQRQGLKMIEFAHKESAAWVKLCRGALSNPLTAMSPTLEAEGRLQQLRFLLVAKSTRVRLADLGSPVENTYSDMDNGDVVNSLEAITKLILSSPGSCGAFSSVVQKYATMFTVDEVLLLAPIPSIRNAVVRQIEKAWAQHKLGHLRLCNKNHPYSCKTFFEACPECKKEAQLSGDEVFRESAKNLFEGDFLKAMRVKPGETHKVLAEEDPTTDDLEKDLAKLKENNVDRPLASTFSKKEIGLQALDAEIERADLVGDQAAGQVKPEKQSTMEEKFLVAMRTIEGVLANKNVNGP